MRQFFRRSSLLILFFATVAFVLTLGIAMINVTSTNSSVPEFLGDTTIALKIKQPNGNNSFTCANLQNLIIEYSGALTICKMYPLAEGAAVYSNRLEELPVEIISGSNMDANELSNLSMSAIIRQDEVINSTQQSGQTLYLNDNTVYNVIGTYKNENEIKYYINLLGDLKSKNDLPVDGLFYIDGEVASQTFCDDLKNSIWASSPNASIESWNVNNNTVGLLSQITSDQKFIGLIILLVLFLLLLNVASVMVFWVEGKKTEIFVKKLSGGRNSQIIGDLFLNYMALVVISFGIGIVLSIVVANLVFAELNLKFNYFSILLSFLICVVVACFFGLMVLLHKLRQQIAAIMR